jgi:hypothetical protein
MLQAARICSEITNATFNRPNLQAALCSGGSAASACGAYNRSAGCCAVFLAVEPYVAPSVPTGAARRRSSAIDGSC